MKKTSWLAAAAALTLTAGLAHAFYGSAATIFTQIMHITNVSFRGANANIFYI